MRWSHIPRGVKVFFLLVAAVLYATSLLAAESKSDVPARHSGIKINPGQFVWSPDGSRLAYADWQGIWSLNQPDFDHPVRLVKWMAGTGAQLAWSPDGERLAFASRRPGDGWGTIWIVNADGSHLVDGLPPNSLVDTPGQRALTIEAWLDSHRIAFGMHCGTGAVCHYIVDVDSGKDFSLCDSRGYLSWSANHEMAVVENHPSIGCTPEGLGIVQASIATPLVERQETRKECLSFFGGCLDSCCSPDIFKPKFDSWQPPQAYNLIEYVLYTRQTLKSSDLMLWEINTAARKPLVTDASDGQWSPDGTKIALRLRGAPRLDRDHSLIGAENGSELTAIVDFPVPHLILTAQPLQSIAWSPSGHALAGKGSDNALYVLSVGNPRATGARKLMEKVDQFQWSAGGREIAGTSLSTTQAVPISAISGELFPPVGADDASKSNAEIVKAYYERTIAQAAHSKNDWRFHLAYAQALDSIGDISGATAEYQVAMRGGNAPCAKCAAQVAENYYREFETKYSLGTAAPSHAAPLESPMRSVPHAAPGSFLQFAPSGAPQMPKPTTVAVPIAELVIIDADPK